MPTGEVVVSHIVFSFSVAKLRRLTARLLTITPLTVIGAHLQTHLPSTDIIPESLGFLLIQAMLERSAELTQTFVQPGIYVYGYPLFGPPYYLV